VTAAQTEQIADGVYMVRLGSGWRGVNVYLVGTTESWALVDCGWPGSASVVQAAAEAVFGPGARPTALLMTHLHQDHAGSAVELADHWGLPVFVHPAELPLAGGYRPEYANPLDRWVLLPVIRLLPRRTRGRLLHQDRGADLVRGYDPAAAPPGLQDWRCIHTPGHTPGHVAFYRDRDGVLITGDAVLTVNLNSVRGTLSLAHEVSGPMRLTSWSWPSATRSIAELAALEPRVLAPGHGDPQTTGAAAALDCLAERVRHPRGPLPQGFFRAVEYSGAGRYRRPPTAYRRMQWLTPLVITLGLAPAYVVNLEVPGRRTGLIRRTTLVQTTLDGQHYLVALAGESEWVRNVRAAGGRVVIGRRQRRVVDLVEVAPHDRPPVIRAYLLRAGRRAGSRTVAAEARAYFGVSADPQREEIEAVSGRYPVFRIDERHTTSSGSAGGP
jgi:glyoxylase-like metal-dependent hydrolase (beta-lactamase superfamily II)